MTLAQSKNIKAFSKVAEIELVYRNKCKASERPTVTKSEDAYNALMQTWDKDKIELQEQFKVMLLDRSGNCMGISTVATGGITNCMVDLKLVFAAAIKARATGIILAHNHPSGSTKPSENDKRLTDRFAEAGKLLDLPVLDHIIVTKDAYLSFGDEGLLH
jgi:DNA repair protein RadC